MTRWEPERASVRLRNAAVAAVGSGAVDLTLDGATYPSVPVYGPMPGVGAKVLVLEQDSSLLVIGNAVSLLERIERLEALHGDD